MLQGKGKGEVVHTQTDEKAKSGRSSLDCPVPVPLAHSVPSTLFPLPPCSTCYPGVKALTQVLGIHESRCKCQKETEMGRLWLHSPPTNPRFFFSLQKGRIKRFFLSYSLGEEQKSLSPLSPSSLPSIPFYISPPHSITHAHYSTHSMAVAGGLSKFVAAGHQGHQKHGEPHRTGHHHAERREIYNQHSAGRWHPRALTTEEEAAHD